MNRGTTTPLLPPSSTTGGVVHEPEFHDIIDIIDSIWKNIADLEKQISSHQDLSLARQLEYYYNLSDYWEEVYLILMGARFYESFL